MSMMSTQALLRLSPDEYLRVEAQSEIRHEFVRGQVFDMVGGTDTHNLISLNIASALRERLRGRPCRVFMADMKVRIAAAEVFYYPDVFVTCDSSDRKPYFKEHPCLIVEVLSETTEGTDRREKFLAYESLESLKEYVLVQQSRRELEVFRRGSAHSPWTKSSHVDDQEVDFPSLGISLTLSQIYEGLDLP
jgi:Uma2 family endonuclease